MVREATGPQRLPDLKHATERGLWNIAKNIPHQQRASFKAYVTALVRVALYDGPELRSPHHVDDVPEIAGHIGKALRDSSCFEGRDRRHAPPTPNLEPPPVGLYSSAAAAALVALLTHRESAEEVAKHRNGGGVSLLPMDAEPSATDPRGGLKVRR